jgi:hypothetical protein
MTDEALLAEIAEYRTALKKAALGGGIQRVAGEQRNVTIFGADIGLLRDTLRAMVAEAIDRGLLKGNGGAILVEIG